MDDDDDEDGSFLGFARWFFSLPSPNYRPLPPCGAPLRGVGELVEVFGGVHRAAVEDVRPHLGPVLLVHALLIVRTLAATGDKREINRNSK